jgi:hypothetical protein
VLLEVGLQISIGHDVIASSGRKRLVAAVKI